MTERCFDKFKIAASDLPGELPIFPLPGALLLPAGRLPLNIFEPRYVNMIVDALQSPTRMIGMMQPLDGESMDDDAPLYQIGCAGRISSFVETEDGRILITLHGICRFKTEHVTLTDRGYRKAGIDWKPYLDDMVPIDEMSIDRQNLLDNLKVYLKHIKMPADWDVIENAPNYVLINSLAMVCPFECKEQQALLEAQTLCERARVMNCLLKMSLHDCAEKNKH